MQSARLPRRLRLLVRGAVQGVGFRPFVYHLARELQLAGWVQNSAEGVWIEVEGIDTSLDSFLLRLSEERPERSHIQSLEPRWLSPVNHAGFHILDSDPLGPKSAVVQADIATCPECLAEVLDPRNRRYLYPFTNCTHCGPRFSIIESLPYDRGNTSMREFTMCRECRAEYETPSDRRFHAQPNACPACGPHLQLWDAQGHKLQERHDALLAAAAAIREGRIVAIKGLGGFHLVTSAHRDLSVTMLRERKRREEKPFALLMPSLDCVLAYCRVSHLESRLLRSPEAPIVLLERLDPRDGAGEPERLSGQIAPGNPNLGVMLPSTPLHHLLMRELCFPVIATSGNLSEEPICTDELEALRRLHGIADLFLTHNRKIIRHMDDSIVRVILGREMMLRRARGYAPLPIQVPPIQGGLGISTEPPPIELSKVELSVLTEPPALPIRVLASPETGAQRKMLAMGAHQKNAIAFSLGPNVFISQHLGDLDSGETLNAFQRATDDLARLYQTVPDLVIADAHPDYTSSREAVKLATRFGARFLQVQHHEAHVLACMAENELKPPVLGVAWDGTGYGTDGTIWGGEFFHITEQKCERIAHLRTFPLPGGEQAAREPRRSALGLCFALARQETDPPREKTGFSPTEARVLTQMLAKRINCPLTSSIGRLFDAVASLVGLRQLCRFEGQAAMELEFAASASLNAEQGYNLGIIESATPQPKTWIVDWEPLVRELLADVQARTAVPVMSARFHRGLADAITGIAQRLPVRQVVLSGGCFQNRVLTELTVKGLRDAGLAPYWHQRVPPNDGGICLGQIVAASRLSL